MTAKHVMVVRAMFMLRPVVKVKVTVEIKSRYERKLIRRKRQSSCRIFIRPGLAAPCDLQYCTLSVPAYWLIGAQQTRAACYIRQNRLLQPERCAGCVCEDSVGTCSRGNCNTQRKGR